jgi:hypothetical protein
MPDAEKIGDRGRDERLGSQALVGATASYAVLVFASLLLLGTPPAAAESGPQVVAWFHENRDAVQWAVWLLTVSIPPLAVMIALLRRLLPSPHRDVFLIGGVTLLTMGGVFSWTLAGLALHADSLEPAIARTVLDVAVFFGPVLTGATTTMMAPVTLLALRGRAHLPVWLGFLGLTAFVEQSIETITIFGSTGFTQPGGAMNLQLGAGLTLAWLLSFGLWGGLRGKRTVSGRTGNEGLEDDC